MLNFLKELFLISVFFPPLGFFLIFMIFIIIKEIRIAIRGGYDLNSENFGQWREDWETFRDLEGEGDVDYNDYDL